MEGNGEPWMVLKKLDFIGRFRANEMKKPTVLPA